MDDGAAASLSGLLQAAHEQRTRQHRGEDCVWHGRGAQSTLASVFVPVHWPEHVSADNKMAQRTDESRVAVSGDEVGLADSLRQGCRASERLLPVADTLNQETVRNHLHATADRIEQGLGEESVCLFDGSDQDWEEQPLPDGPITVGIDGGFVRAAHKEGWFEVIAGKSVVAFRREDNDETPSAKCFGSFRLTMRNHAGRLWELLKSQGMQENQQVVFLSDGGDTVRRLQEYLHPSSEHLIDWFHITMRLTVLQQQRKALQAEQHQIGEEIAKQLESVKHLLWHGNAEEALERLGGLIIELDLLRAFSHAADKLGQGIGEFETYTRNNIEFIPNFGERYRQGETISTAFVESTINQVVSKRFVKKQQMQWTPRGAHLLLRARAKVLNDDLEDVFRGWYPQFHAQAA